MKNRVVIIKSVKASIADVYNWYYHSENFIKSPIVFKSQWLENDGCTGSKRKIVMIAGIYMEEITDTATNDYIRYRVFKSYPTVKQEFTEIKFTEINNNETEVKWTIEIEPPLKVLNGISKLMAKTLYSTIMNASKKVLEKNEN